MKKIFTLCQEIIIGICLVTLLLVGIVALGSKFNIPGGYSMYSVLTGSMEPGVPTGTLIITKIPRSTDDIHQGDIITFIEPGFLNKYVTHRVNQVIYQGSTELFQTKGDANSSLDSWRIAYGSIKGVYQTQFPYLGFFLEFLKSPIGLGIFIFIPLILISIFEIKNIFGILFQLKLTKEEASVRTENNRNQNHFLPVLPLLFFLPILFLSISQSYALFESNTTLIKNNSVTSFRFTPKPTRTPRPSHTPCPDDESDRISNNGANSNNKITRVKRCDDSSKQSNTTENDNNLNSDSNSGGNSASENTSSSSATAKSQTTGGN
jgi:signal peptidase